MILFWKTKGQFKKCGLSVLKKRVLKAEKTELKDAASEKTHGRL